MTNVGYADNLFFDQIRRNEVLSKYGALCNESWLRKIYVYCA